MKERDGEAQNTQVEHIDILKTEHSVGQILNSGKSGKIQALLEQAWSCVWPDLIQVQPFRVSFILLILVPNRT